MKIPRHSKYAKTNNLGVCDAYWFVCTQVFVSVLDITVDTDLSIYHSDEHEFVEEEYPH